MNIMKRAMSIILSMALMVTMLPLTGVTGFAASAAEPEYLTSVKDAGQVMREGMVNREDTIVVYYQIAKKDFTQSKIRDLSNDIYSEAVKHTGNPKEGDYLGFLNGGYHIYAAAKGSSEGDKYLLTLTFNMEYYTTAQQEAELDKAIADLLTQLNLRDKSDYEKICAIHDYIAENVTYDLEGRKDKNNKLCHTAYAALLQGKSVCQGYATLCYRLMLEAGMDCRIISGQSLGDNHAWNIVKMDGKYYNVDLTWDSSTHTYKYFLKGSQDFKDHQANPEYTEGTFTKAYPMAKTGYKAVCKKHKGVEVVKAATVKWDGKIESVCQNCHEVLSTKAIHHIDKVTLSYSKTDYSGKTMSPKLTVKDSFGETISSKYYTVKKPAGRKKVGKYTYKVTFKGNYEGTKSATLTINPPAVTMKKPVAAKSAFTAKWKKSSASSQVSGYEVQYSTSKNFSKGNKAVKASSSKTVSKKISKLKAKKTYYVRVRTYKKISGKYYYSSWSKSQSVKVK